VSQPTISKLLSALFRLSSDGTAQEMAAGIIASNGIAFSPDNRVLYYADSRGPVIGAFGSVLT
jgi:sugar lactone lactonase YvrE